MSGWRQERQEWMTSARPFACLKRPISYQRRMKQPRQHRQVLTRLRNHRHKRSPSLPQALLQQLITHLRLRAREGDQVL